MLNQAGIAFSPDGGQLATGGTDGIVKFWDLKTCTERLALKKQSSEITSVAFSPDGTQLVTCAANERVMIFDTNTGAEIKTLRMGTPRKLVGLDWWFLNFNATFSPDGRRVAASGLKETVEVWDVETGQEVLTLVGHTRSVNGIAFSHDGKWIASAGSDQIVRVWDAASGHEWLRLRGHTSSVEGVAFSPDSRRLASTGLDETVRIWRIAEALPGKGEPNKPALLAPKTGRFE
jgi:WD40 repeat protein